jgi:DNA-binding transcriptional MerR regulator
MDWRSETTGTRKITLKKLEILEFILVQTKNALGFSIANIYMPTEITWTE